MFTVVSIIFKILIPFFKEGQQFSYCLGLNPLQFLALSGGVFLGTPMLIYAPQCAILTSGRLRHLSDRLNMNIHKISFYS